MTDTPVIRCAGADDVEAVLPLAQAFVDSFALRPEQFRRSFQSLVVNDSANLLVAGSGGAIIGYSLGFVHDTFYANGPVAWLEEIMVEPEYRRSGVGALLMHKFEEWAAARGAVLSALATRRASRFYEAIGYAESATYYRRLLGG